MTPKQILERLAHIVALYDAQCHVEAENALRKLNRDLRRELTLPREVKP